MSELWQLLILKSDGAGFEQGPPTRESDTLPNSRNRQHSAFC